MKTNLFKIMRLALFLLPLLGRGLGGGCALLAQTDLLVCASKGYTLTSTAAAPATGATQVTYQWYEDDILLTGKNEASLTIEAGTRAPGTYAYWRVAANADCTGGVASNTFTVLVYPAFSPGSITTASTTTKAGTPPNQIVDNSGDASGGSDNLSYVWVRTGTSSATLTGSDITYDLNTAADNNYSTVGTYYFNRYAKDATCNTAWLAAAGTYTLTVEATSTVQPDGGCTYTETAPVGTFADFHTKPAYSATTYTSLTDERDNKIYLVVKIGGRWIMARNLNYQEDMTFNDRSDQAHGGSFTAYSTASAGSYAIGSFWCPGGVSGNTATSSTLTSCDVWGALYTWETAMSFDGKGGWTEITNKYNNDGAANAENSQFNHGRSADGLGDSGRGICPPNWHVPTDNEWGIILDGLEGGGTDTAHQTATTGWEGTDAGMHAKSKCTCEASSCNDDTNVSWSFHANQGDDSYGFRVLPTGSRNYTGSNFSNRGNSAFFWSSSAVSATNAWARLFRYSQADVYRYTYYRSYGFSVRCIRDSD